MCIFCFHNFLRLKELRCNNDPNKSTAKAFFEHCLLLENEKSVCSLITLRKNQCSERNILNLLFVNFPLSENLIEFSDPILSNFFVGLRAQENEKIQIFSLLILIN